MRCRPLKTVEPLAYPRSRCRNRVVGILRRVAVIASGSALLCLTGCAGANTETPAQPPVPPEQIRPAGGMPSPSEWIRIPVALFYPQGVTELQEDHLDVLGIMHETLAFRDDVHRIRVEAHAFDEGTEEEELRLSEERSRAVVDHMVEVYGMPRELFEPRGYGSAQPAVSLVVEPLTSNLDHETSLRRVEVSLLVRRLPH